MFKNELYVIQLAVGMFSKGRSDVFIITSSNKSCCSTVLNSLKFFKFLFWKTIKGTVTVVQT